MGMSHILLPNQVVHLAQNGSWRDRFTVCVAGKVSGKGNRSTEVKTLLKYIQIIPWALDWWLLCLVADWLLTELCRVFTGCSAPLSPWGSPGRRCRLPSLCIRSTSCSGFSSFCSAGALGTLQIRSSARCTPVEQRVAALTCRQCQPRSSPASPGAGAPPPGAALGAAGAPGRALWVILSAGKGWICCADLNRRVLGTFILGESCKISVTKGTQRMHSLL